MMRRAGRNRREPSLGQGAPFSPTNLTGMMLWLRGDLGVTLGTGVSAWADQSGAGNNVVQATGALQPAFVSSAINGEPAVKPNGTTQFLQQATTMSATPLTAFVVCQCTDQATIRAAVSTSDGLGFVFFTDSATTLKGRTGASGIDVAVTASQPHVYALTSNGASSVMYLDGAQTAGTTSANTNTGLTVGAHNNGASLFWDNYIAEVVYYSRILSAAEISRVGRYLSQRYAIAGSW